MSDAMEGKAVQALPKGQKAGQNLTLYGGRVMPQTFGQVIEYAQMMCKGGLAIPKHLRDQPGICLRVIQQSMAWEMDPWAVASKTYSVNDQLAYESQMIMAVIKKWAPIKERVIPYVIEGQGDSMRCTITVHHAETGEEMSYRSPLKKDIHPQNSPLWKTDPEQQIKYYSGRSLARLHFPDILLGVYDREEVMAMRDITPAEDRKVDNFLNDEEPAKPIEGELQPSGHGWSDRPAGTHEVVDRETGEITNVEVVEEKPVPIDPAIIAKNLAKAAKGFSSLTMLEAWAEESKADIAALPEESRAAIEKLIAVRRVELGEL
jgi:hypothetical protein